jgi:hypothetical protein
VTAQDVSVQLKIGGSFVEQVEAKGGTHVGGDVFSGEQITIVRRYTPLQGLEPDRVDLTFDNDDDRYNLENPTSDLYGHIGRNTQMRVRVAGTTRTTAEATSWRPDATPDHQAGVRGRAWCDVTGLGVLGRLGTWTDALHSPMFRTISNTAGLLGYYPCEDGKQAGTALTNTVAGGVTGANIGGTYQGGDGPDGSEQLVESVDGCAMGGNFVSSTSTAGWQFFFTFKLAELPPSATYTPVIWVKSTVGYIYYIEVNNTNYQFTVVDSAGTTLEQTTVGWGGGGEPDDFIWFRLLVLETAGTISLEPAWYSQESGVLGATLSFTGSHGQPSRWGHTGTAVTDGALYGHIGAINTAATDLLDDDFKNAFNGHSGERALDRFARLTLEEGITRYAISGGSSLTMPMGVQRADTLLKLLQECADTDDALIYDEQADIALTWFSRSERFNQTPALTLTYPGDISPPFRPVFDDADTANYVTAKNRDGGESTVEQTTGAMSTSPPPDGAGKVKKTVDVNIGDEDLLTQIADWWRTKGTVQGARYPSVVVDLLANPGLETDARLVGLGELIQVDGYRAEPILLHVMGIEERVGSHTRALTFTCLDGSVWQTGVWQDTGETDFVWASRTTTLSADRDDSDTAWVFTFTDPDDAWSTLAGYDCLVAGERITVTEMSSVGAVGLVSGQMETTTEVALWVAGVGGTPTRSSDQALTGVYSALITVAGSPASVSMRLSGSANFAPITPATTYTLSFWIYSSAALGTVNGVINWYNGGSFVSSSGAPTVAVDADTWTNFTYTVAAPGAGVDRAQYGPTVSGSPVDGTLLYFDAIELIDPAGSDQNATVTRAVNGVSKAQVSGTPILVASPLRWTL